MILPVFLTSSVQFQGFSPIITATCSHFPNVSSEVERSLLDYAFVLFGEEWLRLVKEDEDEYDREEELEAASKVFFQIYKTEKDVW